jgi:hypothetical protein
LKSTRMKVARISGFVLVTLGLVLGQLAYAPSANAVELVVDGGFEASDVDGDSPAWVEADSLLVTPLCDPDLCGADLARTGDWFAWFGGLPNAGHSASVSQSVTIPAGTTALSYWLQSDGGTAPFNATLTVKVDGTTVKTYTEQAAPDADYSQQLVNISAFANGAAHTLSFSYLNGAAGLTSWFMDDVSIETTLSPATTGTPAVTVTDPVGPSNSTTPKVKGTAEAGSTVTLFANGTCTGPALGSGTAADFAAAGITATVPSDATTTIFAKASKATQFDSACSTTSASYVNDAATPNTNITSPSANAVAKSLTVPIAFTSTEAGSTFTCSLDTAAFASCTSPASVTVTSGQHTFRVIAKDSAQNADPTPASVTFTAYDCKTLVPAVTAAQANADAASKSVSKAKKALKKAKKSGNASKIKKAKKKLKKAKAAQTAANAALAAAQASAAPCGGTVMKYARN